MANKWVMTKKQQYSSKHPFLPHPNWRHLWRDLSLLFSILIWPFFVSIGCFCQASCLSLHGIHTTSLAEVLPLFPLIGLLPSPLTRHDNWTCNSDPGIPIRVSLHPVCIECLSYLSVISLWTSLWPLDQTEYTILPVQMHLELKIFFYSLATPSVSARWLCPAHCFKHPLPPERPKNSKSNISLYSVLRRR